MNLRNSAMLLILLLAPPLGTACSSNDSEQAETIEDMDSDQGNNIVPDMASDTGESPSSTTIRCVNPGANAMVLGSVGSSINVVAVVADPERVTAATLAGIDVAPDDTGLIQQTVETRFGLNHIRVEVERDNGDKSEALCTFLIAPDFVPAEQSIPNAITLQLNPLALAGSVDGTTAESIADLFAAALKSEMFSNRLLTELDTQGPDDIKPVTCDAAFGMTCETESAVDYSTLSFGTINGVNVIAENSLVTVIVGWDSLSMGVSVTGKQRVDPGVPQDFTVMGDVVLSDVGISASLELLANELEPLIFRYVPRYTDIAFSSVTATYPLISAYRSQIEDDTEQYLQGTDGGTFRENLARAVMSNLGLLLQDLLRSTDVRTGAGVVTGIDGTAISLTPTFEFEGARLVATNSLALNLSSGFDAPSIEIDAPTFGVPVGSAATSSVDTVMPASTRVSEPLLNQKLHALWLSGGLTGAIDTGSLTVPTTIAGPSGDADTSSLVLPQTVEVNGELPPVVHALEDELQLMLGLDVRTAGDGVFQQATDFRVGATISASAENQALGQLRVTELVWATDAQLNEEERAEIELFLLVLVNHSAEVLTADLLPTLRPSLRVRASAASFGLNEGIVIEQSVTQVALFDGYLELSGAFLRL